MSDGESQSILCWLQALPEALPGAYDDCHPLPPPSSPSLSRKRKAQRQQPSPPMSLTEMEKEKDLTLTRKRQRIVDATGTAATDPDQTPRPSLRTGRSSASASLSASSASASSSRSGSPKKQFMNLRIHESGIEFRTLDAAPKEEAANLLNNLRQIGRGLAILPHDERQRILQDDAIDAREWAFSFKAAGEVDALPGRIPSPEVVAVVRKRAKKCHEFGHEEAAWNTEVHFRLLESILRDPKTEEAGSLNFTTCTSARPHPRYLPRCTQAKMVDMCLYADLYDDADAMEAQQALCRQTPTSSVNHTDFAPLQLSPMVLSIETKKSGKDLDTAQLQMGIWHAAQWSFLRSAVLLSLQARQAKSTPDEPTPFAPQMLQQQQQEQERQADEALNRLAFLPGVIVQGHKWMLVLSTREGLKTVLWVEQQFGSTHRILETYQVIAGLRELAAWGRDTYLPWFRENILAGYEPG
ncbi:hypothetical protein AK830_g12003 [Neonectria ditissima]|uniref:PD-(D/E)XK nuclease-like domain-containing protein n=1 Tax=Neonectria ditissima TaxID=78410 RepID=A0A0N8H4X3_9HYPO|nr:hypothetical protein AK830_g12003 [Neonectria ditissima]